MSMIYLFRTVMDGGRSRLRPMPHQTDPSGKGIITDLNVQADTAVRSAYPVGTVFASDNFASIISPRASRAALSTSPSVVQSITLVVTESITPSTVSFHMKKLEDAGIVISRKEQYYTVYSLNRDVLETSLFDAAAAEPEQVDEQQRREKKYRQKVIDSFFEYGKLKTIPVQRKKKLICYEVIAENFVPGKVYSEKELNGIIAPIHEDYCTIRRDMISEGILSRNGSEYVRIK